MNKQEWKSAQAERKLTLKGLTKTIKDIKKDMRLSYDDLKNYMVLHNIDQNYPGWEMRENFVDEVVKGYYKILWRIAGLQNTLRKERNEYRRIHILYSLYNGTPYEKIEQSRDENRWEHEISGPTFDKQLRRAMVEQALYAERRKNHLKLQALVV